MGTPSQIRAYAPPGEVSRDDRLWHVLTVGSERLTSAILMTYAIEDILDGQPVVWVASDGSARTLLKYIPGDLVEAWS